MRTPIPALVSGLAVVLLQAGCTLAPTYVRPPAPVPAKWPTGPAYAAQAAAPLEGLPHWQDFFVDASLRKLIGIALCENRDLRVATLNVERARAIFGIRRAELLPSVDLVASGSKTRIPADLSGTGRPRIAERYDVNLGVASWEIDFFGRIRSLKNRALEEFLASEQGRRGAQLLLVSSVAEGYLTLAAARDNLTLSEVTLRSQQAAYALVKSRYDLGLVPELEVFRAQTPLETARRDAAHYTEQVAQAENALNLLLGAPAPRDLLPRGLNKMNATRRITAGLSSEVLLERPDVLRAENMLRAANADIGAARAAFFPRISLSGSLGTASSDLSGLFRNGSSTWSYAPQIVMPIFDARTWSAHRATKVQRDIAVAEYEDAIQNAFREVADALATSGTIQRQLSAQEALVHALAETYRLATSRFEKGIDSYLSVLDAQRSLFAAQQALVFYRLASATSKVRLYAVLGGGWDCTPPACAPLAKTGGAAAD